MLKKSLVSFCFIIVISYAYCNTNNEISEIVDNLIRYDKWDEAKKTLEVFISKNPSSSEGFALYGAVLDQLKNYDEAIIAVRKAINLEKQDEKKGELYYNLSSYYFSKGLKTNALEILDQALNLNKTLDVSYYLKGVIYYQDKDISNAISSWKSYIEITTNKERKMVKIISLLENKINEDTIKKEEDEKKKKEILDKLLNDIEQKNNDTKSIGADKTKTIKNKIEFEEIN